MAGYYITVLAKLEEAANVALSVAFCCASCEKWTYLVLSYSVKCRENPDVFPEVDARNRSSSESCSRGNEEYHKHKYLLNTSRLLFTGLFLPGNRLP